MQAEVNERRRLEGQLALRQKLERIGQLAAGVAHEINTPVQYIGDSIQLLSLACSDLSGLCDRYEHLLTLAHEPEGADELHAAVEQARAAADVEFPRKEIPQSCERALAGVERVTNIVRAMKELAHPINHEQAATDINAAINSTLLVANNEFKCVAQLETELRELPPVICSVSELSQVLPWWRNIRVTLTFESKPGEGTTLQCACRQVRPRPDLIT